MKIDLPKNVRSIIDRLSGEGYSCYAVGGCVRDALRGVEPHDWDITTSALPEDVERLFADFDTVTMGRKYGTIGVVMDGRLYEITTFRLDGLYSDSRHPDNVVFSDSLADDLARRDFTVNAMAYNDTDGLIDMYDGQRDLGYGVIRAVGDPSRRFAEDALRILRALRFASTLGYSIEPATSEAIIRGRKLLSEIAPERIRDELLLLLCGQKVDFVLRRYRAVFTVFIPEIQGTFDFDQRTRHHNRDVYRHTVAAIKNVEPDPLLRATLLFHDIGKPLSQTVDRKGECHYKNHPVLGAAMTEEILRRLCFPRAFIDEACLLIRYHDMRLKPEPAEVKHALKLLGADKLKKLLKLQRADILAQSMYMREEKLENLSAVGDELDRILESGECYSLPMLAVNGSDLIHMGVSSGRRIGEILDHLLDKVIDGELPNTREALAAEAKLMMT